MPKRFCTCTGCAACKPTTRTHGVLYDADSTGGLKCPGCTEQARKRKNTDPPGRPSAAQRGYGAEWKRVSAKVIARAVGCHWCGGQFTKDDPATADHIIPKARGGTNDEQNLVGAHRSCNSRRGGQMRKNRRASL